MRYEKWQKDLVEAVGNQAVSSSGESPPSDSSRLHWVLQRLKWHDDCLIYTGHITVKGYGRAWFDRKPFYIHRFVYEQLNGPIPDGFVMDHLCKHPSCVLHLEIATIRENNMRGTGPYVWGAWQRARTHCPRGHPYDEANTRIGIKGGRNCRACANRPRPRQHHWQHV